MSGDDFEALMQEAFGDTFEELAEDEAVDYTAFSVTELLDLLEETTAEIRAIKQILSPRTQEGRDLHSKRYAIQLALRGKGFK